MAEMLFVDKSADYMDMGNRKLMGQLSAGMHGLRCRDFLSSTPLAGRPPQPHDVSGPPAALRILRHRDALFGIAGDLAGGQRHPGIKVEGICDGTLRSPKHVLRRTTDIVIPMMGFGKSACSAADTGGSPEVFGH